MYTSNKNISKSIFLSSLICQTKGWFKLNGIQNTISIGDQLRSEEGKEIGVLARSLYPDGQIITGHGDHALKMTENLLNDKNVSSLFEAAFKNNNCVTRADILVKEDRGWHLIEVKSSTDFSQKSKKDQESLIDDAAYTSMVINDHVNIEKVSIMTLSKKFRLGMDVKSLFVTEDITQRVFDRKLYFLSLKDSIENSIQSTLIPTPNWIFECKDCEFFKTQCIGNSIKNSIFNLPRISEKKCSELFGINCFEISKIPENYLLTEKQQKIRGCTIDNTNFICDKLTNQLGKVKFPAYYLDFETIKTAYPLYQDVAPHEQIVTQYSLHKLDEISGVPNHTEYLADPKIDCRKKLIEKLLDELSETGSIIVYSSFEKTILNGLSMKFPDLTNKIVSVIDRIIDLKSIIESHYYHPDFYGSYSIKSVLPVLVPNMSYKNLDVKNGDEAIAAFYKMTKFNIDENEENLLKSQLLKYCKQDTLAMVELHKKLVGMIYS